MGYKKNQGAAIKKPEKGVHQLNKISDHWRRQIRMTFPSILGAQNKGAAYLQAPAVILYRNFSAFLTCLSQGPAKRKNKNY